jgi:transcriptional regulator with XRE-family HTH domain
MVENPQVRLRVGRKVKRLRLLRGWSQEQLAERVGNTEKHISQVERGKVNVGIDVLASVASELAVDVAELFLSPSKLDGAPTYTITRQELERIEEALRVVERVKSSRTRRSK